jgi:hypothetical protein
MIGLLRLLLSLLSSPFKSQLRLEAEKAALRDQLIVLRRKVQGRVQLTKMIAGSLSSCIAGKSRQIVETGVISTTSPARHSGA